MSGRAAWSVAALGVLAASASGCGLKGSLEMPERSTNVVIRGPQQPEGGPGTAAPAAPAPAPAPAPGEPTKATEPPTTRTPADDRLPPPPLPGGNPGSARGG